MPLILIVDDSPTEVHVMQKALERHGFRTAAAADGAEGVRLARMRLGLPDASGRKTPEEIKGADTTLKADLAIMALGFDPEDVQELFRAPKLGVTRWGTFKTDPKSLQTNLDGVYAAGDIVRGASLVVWAIRDGRDAAQSIHTYLSANANKEVAAPRAAAEAAE